MYPESIRALLLLRSIRISIKRNNEGFFSSLLHAKPPVARSPRYARYSKTKKNKHNMPLYLPVSILHNSNDDSSKAFAKFESLSDAIAKSNRRLDKYKVLLAENAASLLKMECNIQLFEEHAQLRAQLANICGTKHRAPVVHDNINDCLSSPNHAPPNVVNQDNLAIPAVPPSSDGTDNDKRSLLLRIISLAIRREPVYHPSTYHSRDLKQCQTAANARISHAKCYKYVYLNLRHRSDYSSELLRCQNQLTQPSPGTRDQTLLAMLDEDGRPEKACVIHRTNLLRAVTSVATSVSFAVGKYFVRSGWIEYNDLQKLAAVFETSC
ncbi:hypothetical protein BCR43DRAFT_522272 [Syncephalastrum racemosum]|uniref:Uncharacterized protein n=1 Tax=Syncephalastrum racemosum TaxID=13706 RepID=A0A1X2HQ51_SYNRA|nr:hypothetical protein BCR43DRAFT_522272 [Syncephalastrum racemosum]